MNHADETTQKCSLRPWVDALCGQRLGGAAKHTTKAAPRPGTPPPLDKSEGRHVESVSARGSVGIAGSAKLEISQQSVDTRAVS